MIVGEERDLGTSGPEVFRYGLVGKTLALSLVLALGFGFAAFRIVPYDIAAAALAALLSFAFSGGFLASILFRLMGRIEVYPDRVVIRQPFKAPVSIHNDYLKTIETLTWRRTERTVLVLVLEDGRRFLLSPYERLYRLREVLLERIGDDQLETEPILVGLPPPEPLHKWLAGLAEDLAPRKTQPTPPPVAESSQVASEPHSEGDENRNGRGP